jgi:hypothetical protein
LATVSAAGGAPSLAFSALRRSTSSAPLQSDEAIVAVEGRSGKFVDFLQFTTNKGRVRSFGGGGGTGFVVPLPAGDEVHGIRTFSNKLIDAIAFFSYLP